MIDYSGDLEYQYVPGSRQLEEGKYIGKKYIDSGRNYLLHLKLLLLNFSWFILTYIDYPDIVAVVHTPNVAHETQYPYDESPIEIIMAGNTNRLIFSQITKYTYVLLYNYWNII